MVPVLNLSIEFHTISLESETFQLIILKNRVITFKNFNKIYIYIYYILCFFNLLFEFIGC